MSQSQPVIPVTMQYGDGSNCRIGHEMHNIEREVHRSNDQVKRDVSENAKQIIADVNATANAGQTQTRISQSETRQAIERSTDYLAAEGNRNIDHLGSEANRNTDHLGSQANRNTDHLAAEANRNADFVNNSVHNASTQGLLATQNTATATQLGVQNTATATQLAIQNTATSTQAALNNLFSQLSATNNVNQSATMVGQANIQQAVLTQAQSILLGQKDAEVNASNNRAALSLQMADYKAATSLQACENAKDIQLQAANYKAYLENHITKTAADGILKTSESACKIIDKIAECCCENKLGLAAINQLIVSTSSNNQVSALQQSLAAAQNDILLAKIDAIKSGGH